MKTNEQIIDEVMNKFEEITWIDELSFPMGALQDIEIVISNALSLKEQKHQEAVEGFIEDLKKEINKNIIIQRDESRTIEIYYLFDLIDSGRKKILV